MAERLAELERVARERGFAVGVGHPYDTTLVALADWLAGLEDRGFRLAPLSAVVARRASRLADRSVLELTRHTER